MPSVRGRERAAVAATMIISGTASGALVGFGAGVIGQLVPAFTTGGLVLLMVLAVVLDLAHTKVPALRPPSVGKQVPIEWGRMFSPLVVAVLYGARLGVGPLTILSTWLWWAVTIGAAAAGVATSVTVGALFGFVRLTSTVLASLRAEQAGHTSWFVSLRSHTTRAWLGLDATAVALVAIVLVAAR